MVNRQGAIDLGLAELVCKCMCVFVSEREEEKTESHRSHHFVRPFPQQLPTIQNQDALVVYL